jgi:CPA2 family monovalent cation:H+ antiporter-2
VVVAIGDPFTTRLATERARALNPRLTIVSRARGAREVNTLLGLGVARVADPEVEAALELARAALQRMGVSGPELAAIVLGLRRRAYGEAREPGREGPESSDTSSEPSPTA